eukprot:7988823-Pyramimonas_sp.AAC.1
MAPISEVPTNMGTFEPVPVGFLDGSLGPDDMLFTSEGDEKDVSQTGPRSAETQVESDGEDASVKTFTDGVSAAREGNLAELERLCISGWRSNDADEKGCTALMWAAGGGQLDMCALLIKHHADVNYVNRAGRTALHWAARNGHVEACAWLASHGADVHATAKDNVNTFHWAVWGRNIATCEWALAAGVDPLAVNRWGCSAIHWAGAA